MSPAWALEARAALAAVAELVGARPGSAPTEELRTALLECDARLDRTADVAAVLAGIERVVGLAITLYCDGELPAAALQALARAKNECLGAIHDPTLGRVADPPRAVAPLLMASRTVPWTRVIEREPYAPADGTLRAPVDEPPASTPEPSNDVDDLDDGDDGSNAAPAPRSCPWERPVREDWRPEEGVQPPHPPVRLARAVAVTTPSAFYAELVGETLDLLAARGRERVMAPLDVRDEVEFSILRLTDALLATGGACVASIAAWWRQSLELDDPWTSWAAVFALGSIAGADTADAVRRGLEELPAEAGDHAEVAAEALAVVPHPYRGALAADLLGSPHPIARAVGVELSSCLGGLAGDALVRELLDPNVAVMSAVARAAARFRPQDIPAVVPVLERLVDFPHPEVAWLAARTLLTWGNTRPYDLARSGGRLLSVLGAQAIEIFVLAGSIDDLAILQRIVDKRPVTPAMLSALARFGHPGIWAYLVHQLANEDLVHDAAEALVELFGSAIPGDALRNASAWRQGLLRMRPDVSVRYRRGEPWNPGVVADECLAGRMCRQRVEPRLDELAARAGLGMRPNLSLWGAEMRPALERFGATARHASLTWPARGWH